MFPTRARCALVGLTLLALPACGGGESESEDPSSSEETVIDNPHGSALEIGRGFASHSASTRGKCIVPGALAPRAGSSAQQVSFEMREVQSFQSLAKLMSLSGNGRFGSGIYGTSASFKFFESSEFTSYNTYLMIHVKVVNTDLALKEHLLTPAAKQALTAGNDAFRKLCGDGFISQRSEGGEFYAVVEFKTKSEAHKKEVVAKIRSHGGLWSAGADFKQSMQSLSQIAETDVEIIRHGGIGALPGLGGSGYSGLVDYALSFPTIVSPQGGNPWVIGYTVEDYDVVPGVVVPTPDLSTQRSAVDLMGDMKLTQRSYQNRVQYILRNQDEFQNVDPEALQAASNVYNDNLNKLELQAKRCLASPEVEGACTVPTDLVMPNVVWPTWDNGLSVMDRCELGRRWAVHLGILDAAGARTFQLQDWTVYFMTTDPHSGFASASSCDETPQMLQHLPKELP